MPYINTGPKRSKMLSDLMSTKPEKAPKSLAEASAGMGSQLVDALMKKKMRDRARAKPYVKKNKRMASNISKDLARKGGY
ncbi:MAG: hypothetical protein V3R25_05820 [Nitrosomonadaceae bacterium]